MDKAKTPRYLARANLAPREQLEGKIQERYGYEKDRTKKETDDWYSTSWPG